MIIYRKLEKTITGTVDGKPFNLIRTKKTEKDIKAFVKTNATSEEVLTYITNTHNEEVAGANKYLTFNPVTNEYFLQLEGVDSKQPIPLALVDFIEESFDKDIDFMPIIKAWARLLNNPRYTPEMGNLYGVYLRTKYTDDVEVDRLMEEEGYSKEAAINLCTYSDLAITQEGLLATYKVAEIVTWEWVMEEQEDGSFMRVRNSKYKTIPAILDSTTGEVLEEEKREQPEFKEDFKFTPAIWKDGDKFYSGNNLGYVYEIGKMQFLPVDALRNLNNTSGGGGLYIGGLNYIKYFRNENRHVLTCFVNPGDILSFQAEGHAIRVDALFPNNVWEEDVQLKGIYHSSDYDALSSYRLEKLIADAIANEVDLKEGIESEILF